MGNETQQKFSSQPQLSDLINTVSNSVVLPQLCPDVTSYLLTLMCAIK